MVCRLLQPAPFKMPGISVLAPVSSPATSIARAYTGSTGATGGPGSTTFAGTFNGGSRSGTLNGAFFSSPTDAAAYQAGSFSIRGGGYRAGGVFAGQR